MASRSRAARARQCSGLSDVMPMAATRESARDLECATMKHMKEVGIRALKQNASKVVAEAAAGEIIVITDRGRPVAQITPLPKSRLQQLIDAGLATPAEGSLADRLPPQPLKGDGPTLTETLLQMRDEERS
jgi:prevent-host-death family protein